MINELLIGQIFYCTNQYGSIDYHNCMLLNAAIDNNIFNRGY